MNQLEFALYIKELDHKVAFKVLSRYFANILINSEMKSIEIQAIKDNDRLEHAGSMGMYNLLIKKIQGKKI